jgi:hypothetical protein
MAETPKKKDETAQSKRFKEKAKELGADESGEAFERALKKILPSKKVSAKNLQ